MKNNGYESKRSGSAPIGLFGKLVIGLLALVALTGCGTNPPLVNTYDVLGAGVNYAAIHNRKLTNKQRDAALLGAGLLSEAGRRKFEMSASGQPQETGVLWECGDNRRFYWNSAEFNMSSGGRFGGIPVKVSSDGTYYLKIGNSLVGVPDSQVVNCP